MAGHFLIIDARFYEDISDALVAGAAAALEASGATFERVSVPGVLEIPAAMAMALRGGRAYDGFVLLGCVIRGETTHDDIVANESARAIMTMAAERALAVGNGILTVENDGQAWARARDKDKGGADARAALAMAALRRRFGVDDE